MESSESDEAKPTLNYASPTPSPGRRRWAWLVSAVTFVLLFLFLAMLLVPPLSGRSRPSANRAKCANNLRQIALAAIMYAQDNQRQFPATVQLVLSTQDITSEVFVCPSTSDTRAKGSTTAEIVADLTAGGHLSYIYCGQGLTLDTESDVVVAIEPLGNHDNDGANVAFADTHVEWFSAQQARAMLDQFHSGARPVRWPPR